MKKMRVVLVDDEIMIREGFKKLFNWEEHDCQVVPCMLLVQVS